MADVTIIDSMYEDFDVLISLLDKEAELSLRNTAEEHFRKSLLLASASFFEYQIVTHLITYINNNSQNNQLIVEFLKNKAINRQYHTYFNWDSRNANQFFGLFGRPFFEFMEEEIRRDGNLEESIKAFIQLGSERNRLIHGNFAVFPMNKTSEEIYDLFKKATIFTNLLPIKLQEFSEKLKQ